MYRFVAWLLYLCWHLVSVNISNYNDYKQNGTIRTSKKIKPD